MKKFEVDEDMKVDRLDEEIEVDEASEIIEADELFEVDKIFEIDEIIEVDIGSDLRMKQIEADLRNF